MSKLVDIIVTVYNKEHTIQRCIDSILAQDYENINVIIIDDGSSDSSYSICSRYNDKRIKLFYQENAGVGKARNAGISKSTGNKIVFVDADDYVSTSYISDLMKYNQYDMVVQGYITCDEEGTSFRTKIPTPGFIESNQYGDCLFTKETYKYMTMLWNKLFDTGVIRTNNIEFRDIKTGEDVCFVFDYLQHTESIAITNEANYHYVLSSDSLTRRDIADIWLKQTDINDYCRKSFYKKYEKIWANMYVRAAKRTLGEAAKNKKKFYLQVRLIRDDKDFLRVKINDLHGTVEKIIYILIMLRCKFALWMIYRFV